MTCRPTRTKNVIWRRSCQTETKRWLERSRSGRPRHKRPCHRDRIRPMTPKRIALEEANRVADRRVASRRNRSLQGVSQINVLVLLRRP